MTVQGTAGANTTSVTIPAHQAGDVIIVTARRASNSTPPTPPTPGGTVPTWVIAQTGGANLVSLVTGWVIATASTHTTGVWTNANNICVLVLRPDSGKTLGLGPSSTGNANATLTIVYPALTLSTLAGSSWGVRCGTRGGGATEVANAPTDWTNRIAQPAVTPILVIHTRASLTANPTADTVSTPGASHAYRAHTLEVTETSSGAPQQPMATII